MNEQSTMMCPRCGTTVRVGVRFCTRCGNNLGLGAPALAAGPASGNTASEAPTVPSLGAIDTANAPTVALPRPQAAESPTLTGMQAIGQRALRQISGTATHAGQVRAHNEDYVAKLDYSLDQSGTAAPMGLYIVADGMGGYEAGEKASRESVRKAFVDFIEGHILNDLKTATRKLAPQDAASPLDVTLRTLVEEANRLVFRKRQQTGSNRGTTIAAALIIGNKGAVANVGDSRTYLMRNNALAQISHDHSYVYSLFKAGQITEEQIYTHPQKNEIYRSLGEREDVKVDVFDLDLVAGDRLLLCSDGLWEMVRNGQISDILRTAATPQAACDRLVAAAFDNGGEDNISALAVYLE